MADLSAVGFNIGAFISTLFLLEYGADKFIDHSSIIASRTGIPEVIIGLLTAGAEWEELAVIVAALAQGRSSIAIGNVVGACISNILGAFSLGLLCYSGEEAVEFDRSSRIYSLVVLILTVAVTPVIYFPKSRIWTVCGVVLIAAFCLYFLLVSRAIVKGVLAAPEDSDSDSDDPDDEDDEASEVRSTIGLLSGSGSENVAEATRRRQRHTLLHHCVVLLLGFVAICLAGYVLSQASINIIDQLGMSDMLFSVVILAIATTLPEKLIAVMSGYRGHCGIMVANCTGSNIFLLTLCCGITMVGSDGILDGEKVKIAELAVLCASTAAFTATIWFGAKYARLIGGTMILGYVAFIILEFTVIHGTSD